MRNIISIQGLRNSGKDETTKYINYLLNNPKCLHHYWIGKLLKFKTLYNRWSVDKYASKLKKMLAILINVDEERFEDRIFKEQYYFNFTKYELLHESDVPKRKKLSDRVAIDYILSIRQLLQFFGTEVMRKYFGDSLWTLATLKSHSDYLIVADQRFIIENSISKKLGAYTIHIERPNCEVSLHSSEKQLIELLNNHNYDVLLKNEGTLKDLFNNCKDKNIIHTFQDKLYGKFIRVFNVEPKTSHSVCTVCGDGKKGKK